MAIFTIRNSSCAEPQGGWVEYGLLYNWYAATDARELTSSNNWTVPSDIQVESLVTYIGGVNVAGGKLKKTGSVFWADDNGTDDYGFGAKGGGRRNLGVFDTFRGFADYWTSTQTSGNSIVGYGFNSETTKMGGFGHVGTTTYNLLISQGYYIRLVSDATGISDGTTTTYTGNDGKVYLAVAINGLYWLAENLAETKYRNGDIIPEVTDNTAWSNLTSGALCSYNNDWTYSGRTKPSYY